ncbi:asparagine--tRNA ligase [Flammeovirga yaeyamensis]|uniref:Asparagine--tRNA ligase n=1 Tax=Flammeovirga yaeyamensis TaxID=367791 RepID=A0AAX1N3H2_9BACT|nr:asparagine--tRNA ligase [Flammeovirga yaeyamensis]MBB3700116.1 asparaginyl-tRNA synthetase [Flammeovirga yaeyamensis]NMF37253.1 asparagine--tRNA ligase [Flammeovirga yaeyamensis]QWG00941.1 asparagine--tRNA ligase [Flammeovirga yaeyamensis]
MKRTKIKDLLATGEIGAKVNVKGWVRTFRSNRFIALNDGSTINNLQAVVDFENTDEDLLKRLTTSAAVSIDGTVVESQGKGQRIEITVDSLEILGDADPDEYPLQPKRHSLEFLREKAHLRPRTQTMSAVYRVRNALAYGIHKFFNEKGFIYMHTPIVTGSDAEGAGEMFKVTNLDLKNPPLTEDGEIDYKEDFFGKAVNLSVSGQLEAEVGAMSMGEVYTFGPTFRAENSNTTRHLAEFWMIEPEMAFYDLDDNMDLAEEMIKYLIDFAMEQCPDDLAFLDQRYAQEQKSKPQNERSELGLVERLKFVSENNFERLTYTEAIEVLKRSKPFKKGKFKYPVDWGIDLQSEHERYLVEKEFKKPVILTDYPKDIKSFYMKQNDDGKTVRAMDVLFPGIGEIIGGSQREDSLEKLQTRMEEMGVPQEELWWYLELRKFGTAPHSGFGLGFERIVLFVSGMSNIRDVIPFPRAPKSAEF